MAKIRIYIHYSITDRPWGGGNSFLKAFRKYIIEKRNGEFEVVNNKWGNYDIFFMNGGHKAQGKYLDLRELKTLKFKHRFFHNKRPKIIYRLDGARFRYNKMQSPMDTIQYEALHLADFVIFQSDDSQDAFRELGYKANNFVIIPNGVDQDIFNMKNKRDWDGDRKLVVLSVNWSSNIFKGYPVISKFAEHPEVESIFVGNWNKNVPSDNIKLVPPIKQLELAKYYRNADVFLHPSANEACPNVVLEALSSGLPVIYHPSGGTRKIAEQYGIALPEIINHSNINRTIERIKQNYTTLRKHIANDHKNFSIETIGEKYLEQFKRIYNNG